MADNVMIHYLEIDNPDDLKGKNCPDERFIISENFDKDFRVNKSLYILVGTDYEWTDKLGWSDEQWKEHAEDDRRRLFIATYNGTTAGYYELLSVDDSTIDIDYFGLAPGFTGRGFGGYLLTHAISTAFGTPARRVTVNTCTKDHPAALPNYLARGFKEYKKSP